MESWRHLWPVETICMELKEVGLDVGERRVGRLMKINGIRPVRARKHKVTTDSHHRLRVAANWLDGNFVADAPNRKWAGDITPLAAPTLGLGAPALPRGRWRERRAGRFQHSWRLLSNQRWLVEGAYGRTTAMCRQRWLRQPQPRFPSGK